MQASTLVREQLDNQVYAGVQLDGLTLLIPQPDVRILEPASEIDPTDPPPAGIGWIHYRKQRLPVYFLSEALAVVPHAAIERKVCVVINSGVDLYALLCSDILLVRETSLKIHPIPSVMSHSQLPLQGIADHAGGLGFITSAEAILHHIRAGQARLH